MEKAYSDLIYLASCAVNGAIPDARRVADMDFKKLYKAASRHMLTSITAFALERTGIHNSNFIKAKAQAIRKNVILDTERKVLFEKLDAARIWHMPLKGAILKNLYPSYGMRQMADNDILFDASRADDVKAIMEGLGFTTVSFGHGNHDVYHKSPVYNFEMHRALFGSELDNRILTYYQDIKDTLIPCGGFELRFSPENFYVYMVAHEYKHYSESGTGLRSLLDIYIYLQKIPLDMDYVNGEMEKLGIGDFEKKNRNLATHLFGEEPLTSEDKAMLDYIIGSGTYGNLENRVNNKVRKYGGRWRYIKYRIFMPLDMVKSSYPFFCKYKVFLPVLFIYRIGRGLTISGKQTIFELKSLMKQKE